MTLFFKKLLLSAALLLTLTFDDTMGVMLGGTHTVESPLEDEYVKMAVNEGMYTLNSQRDQSGTMLALEVVEVNQQVVSGLKYDMVVKIAPSLNCQYAGERLASYFESDECVADTEAAELYHMQIWARPWLEETPYELMAAEPLPDNYP